MHCGKLSHWVRWLGLKFSKLSSVVLVLLVMTGLTFPWQHSRQELGSASCCCSCIDLAGVNAVEVHRVNPSAERLRSDGRPPYGLRSAGVSDKTWQDGCQGRRKTTAWRMGWQGRVGSALEARRSFGADAPRAQSRGSRHTSSEPGGSWPGRCRSPG